jgi:hypothetical protein
MTVKRDLKKRVRARQARTGERYTTALEHVLAEKQPSAVEVVEMVDLSALAAELGMLGRVLMYPHLRERVDARTTLRRLREVLLATADEPGTVLFRAVLLEGKPLPPPSPSMVGPGYSALHMALMYVGGLRLPRAMAVELMSEGARFLVRARAGLGGASPDGRMLAFPVEGRACLESVVGLLSGIVPSALSKVWPATVMLGSAEAMLKETDNLGGLVPDARGQP